MRFTVVDEKEFIERREQKKLKYEFMRFIKMNVKVARVDITDSDYKSIHVAYNVLSKGAQRHEVPVQVTRMGDSIYFVRTDI
jgi:hypothetical protein